MHSPRVRIKADQEPATFLWVVASCVIDYVLELIGWN